MNKRKIKPNNSHNYSSELNAFTFDFINNNDNISNLVHIEDNEIKNYIKKTNQSNQNNQTSQDNQTKQLLYPSIILDYSNILHVYNIKSIDDLLTTIDNFILNNKRFDTINRILNVYIKKNFKDLKINNNIIHSIIINLLKTYYSDFEINNKNILNFIKNWFNDKNHNDNSFNFDLFNDIKIFLGIV